MVNKLDRLILELCLTPLEAYERLKAIIAHVNMIVSSFHSEKYISGGRWFFRFVYFLVFLSLHRSTQNMIVSSFHSEKYILGGFKAFFSLFLWHSTTCVRLPLREMHLGCG